MTSIVISASSGIQPRVQPARIGSATTATLRVAERPAGGSRPVAAPRGCRGRCAGRRRRRRPRSRRPGCRAPSTASSDSRSSPLQPTSTAASSGAVMSVAPAPTDSLVAQQQQAGAERRDGVGESVHHQGLHGVEEGRAEVLLEDDARRCPSDRGAAMRRADRARCSRALRRPRARWRASRPTPASCR